ncbi:MAG: ABC transporter permease [Actinomycetota bacterium]
MTIRGLIAHKLRFVLTAVAVILGVMFVSGTFVLTATVNKSFDDLIADIFEGTDAQVRGVELVGSSFVGETPRRPVPSEALEVTRAVDGVAVAEPSVEVGYAQVVGADGEEIGGGFGPPTFGFSWTDNEDLNPFRLEPGSAEPAAEDEIVIDRATADDGDIAVGDRVEVLTQQSPKRYEVVGIAKFGTEDSALGASIIHFTLREAQHISDLAPNEFSDIGVVADDGVSQDDVRDRIEATLANPDLEIVTGRTLIEENQSEVDDFIRIFNLLLLGFAFVSLLVAVFLIYNTFSIVVAQRTREMALLRAIGAGTRQVWVSIVVEAVVVGAVASGLGFAAGVLVAQGLLWVLGAIGLEVPARGLVIPPVAPVASMVVGTTVTVLAAVVPALRASRVPPVAALRDVAIERRTGFGRRFTVGAALTFGGAALMLYSLFTVPDNAVVLVGIGAGAMFIGVFVIGPVIARPLSRVIGAPLPRLKGITGVLARENAVRNPRRTAATATALMIGVSLVGFITIFAASAKESISVTLDRELKTDYIVTAGSGFGGIALSPALAEGLAALPELSAVTAVRYAAMDVDERTQIVTSFDARQGEELLDLGVVAGSLAALTVDGVAITREYADAHDLALDAVLEVTYPTGPDHAIVQALYEGSEIGMSTDFTISLESFDAKFAPQQRLDWLVFAKLASGVSAEEGRAAIEPVLEDYPTAELRDNAEFKELQEQAIDTVVNIVYGLLFLAAFIAIIGIANTLALSVHERTREIGLLRAVGMARAQVRSVVRWESVIIAVLGALLGVALGLFFGWAVVRAVREEGFTEFAIAPGQLLAVIVVASVAGVGAAYFPARRAAKLDILHAVGTE